VRDQVLDLVSRHLRHSLKPSGGGNYVTKCPFHKGGEEKKPSFSINPEKGLFNCFTCHVAGDVEYMLKLLGLPSFQVEVEIKSIKPLLDRNRELLRLEKQHAFTEKNPFEAPVILPEAMLGIYEWMPLKLVEAGFSPAVLQELEVGFDRVNQRITYPIRDFYGNLAGFAGGATLDWQAPKYKVYQGTRKNQDGTVVPGDFGDWFDEQFPGYRFENHEYLWNFHRVYKRLAATSDPSATVFVVEGYKACMWMVQAGYVNTVALMGSYISDRQRQLLQLLDAAIYLFLDNDDAGKKATIWVGELLFPSTRKGVHVVPYPEVDEDTQPDDYLPEGIHQFVQQAKPFETHQVEVLQSNPDLLKKIQKKRSRKWQ
jgi:DNA primase